MYTHHCICRRHMLAQSNVLLAEKIIDDRSDMKIWITRHGQTSLNRARLMQGRTDQPLNETGIAQAEKARANIKDVTFDKVYASPLSRAIDTASIIGNVDKSEVCIDPRIIEVDFGRYEKRPYARMGLHMTLYWLLPTVIPAPKTVEPVSSMKKRAASFLEDVIRDGEKNHYENVLVACRGGIMRALCGYMLGRKNGLMWNPKPRNCEIRVFDGDTRQHRILQRYRI